MAASSRRIPALSKVSMRPWDSASMVRAISPSTTETTCQAMTARTMPAPTALRTRIASARRKAVAPKSLPSAVTNHVTGAANRVEQRRVEIAIDLGAQARHVHIDHIGLRIEVIVPDMFEQHGTRNHLAGVLHQIFEQPEFARLQNDLLGPTRDFVRQPVKRQVGDPEDCLLRRTLGAAARQRLDSGQKLGERVRLRQIVVAAGAQPLDPVVDLAERREDQDRRLVFLLAKGAD